MPYRQMPGAPDGEILFVAAELGFFLKVIVAAMAAAKAPHAIDRLVAIPAASLGLQCEQARVACSALPCSGKMRLLIGTRFNHDFLLNFAVEPGSNSS